LLFYVCVLCTFYVNLCAIHTFNKCNLLTYLDLPRITDQTL